jgi:cytochrome c
MPLIRMPQALLTGMLAVGLLGVPGRLWAQQQDGAQLFATKTCLACHGKDAKTPLLPDYPRLAGQMKDYLFRQMVDIKSGARSNGNTAAMKGVMPLVNEEEMQAIAAWLSTLK